MTFILDPTMNNVYVQSGESQGQVYDSAYIEKYIEFSFFSFFFQTLTQELNVYKTNTYRMRSSEKTDHIYPTYAVGKQMMKKKKSIQYCT